LQKYLKGKGLWSEDQETQIKAEAEALINKAIQEAEAVPAPEPEEMFRYTFAELTATLEEQKEDYLAFLKEKEN
jgi:pyruvate dehydrogenase E1 component alpha subunit